MCECEGQTGSSASYRDCFVSGLISCWFVQCCTNVETITLTSILNLPRTKSDMVSYIVYTVSVLPLVLFHACVMMSVLSNTCSVYLLQR